MKREAVLAMFSIRPHKERADKVLTHPEGSNLNGSRKDHVMAATHICSIPYCSKPHVSRGWCSSHYLRWKRHGDPLSGRTSQGEPLAFLEDALAADTDECISWPFGKGLDGRARIVLNGRKCIVSRVVCERAHGTPPTPKHEAAHSCGMGHEGCINPRHLRWATASENQKDRAEHGTHTMGERNPKAVLTESDVHQIRRLIADGNTRRALAREYGVSRHTIADIAARRTWAWLEDSQMG